MRAKPVDLPPPNWVLNPNVKQRSAVQEYIFASFSLTWERGSLSKPEKREYHLSHAVDETKKGNGRNVPLIKLLLLKCHCTYICLGHCSLAWVEDINNHLTPRKSKLMKKSLVACLFLKIIVFP